MRNLRQHPVTVQEIEQCLLDLAEEISTRNAAKLSAGDMRPLLLTTAAKIVVRTGFSYSAINELT